MTRSEAELTTPFARFLSVGLGLLYLGRQDAVEATLEVGFTTEAQKAGSPDRPVCEWLQKRYMLLAWNCAPHREKQSALNVVQ